MRATPPPSARPPPVSQPCPNCLGPRVAPARRSRKEWLGGAFLLSGVLFLVGIFFPPLWLLLPVLWVAGLSGATVIRGKAWRCLDCHHVWDTWPASAEAPDEPAPPPGKRRLRGHRR